MPDYGFYIKRKQEENTAHTSNATPMSSQPTDLPDQAPKKLPARSPSDLPLPRHRPGEPIMYDPPTDGVETFPITSPDSDRIHSNDFPVA